MTKTGCLLRNVLLLLAVIGLTLVPAAGAIAQVVEGPDLNETPLGPDVSGFLGVSFGLLYLPVFNTDVESNDTNFDYVISDEYAQFPGFSAHMFLMPAWGNNAMSIEGGYELIGVHWNQDVHDSTDEYSGDSTLALGLLSLSANYVRFFLSGNDRIYLLAGGGYVWETANLSTETGDEGATDTTGFPNWRLNSGIGYLHQMRAGAVGAEFRADFPLNDSELGFSDPYGSFDMTLEHPVMLRLCLTLMVGRLKERPLR